MTLIEHLPEGDLDKYIVEATEGGTELEPTLAFLTHEKNRRLALAVAAEQADLSTGFYDATSGDQPTQPIPHVTDSVWADWAQPKPTPKWERAPLPPSPKYLHSPLNYPPVDVE